MEQLKQLFRSVVENAGQPLLEARHEEQIRQLLEAAACEDPAKVKSAAIACAEELAGAQPAEVRERFIGDLIRLLGTCTPNSAKPAPPAPNKPEERLERFVRSGQTGALPWLLDLTNQHVGDAGVVALAASPWLEHLSALILSGCHIGDEGVKALAASPWLANLNRLTLWDNHIGDAGVKAAGRVPIPRAPDRARPRPKPHRRLWHRGTGRRAVHGGLERLDPRVQPDRRCRGAGAVQFAAPDEPGRIEAAR